VPGTGDYEFLSTAQLAEELRVDPRTTRRWRATGEGPPYIRVGRRAVLYDRRDVERWLAARRFAHQAAEATACPLRPEHAAQTRRGRGRREAGSGERNDPEPTEAQRES
jgi:Helix-turn-helix domain